MSRRTTKANKKDAPMWLAKQWKCEIFVGFSRMSWAFYDLIPFVWSQTFAGSGPGPGQARVIRATWSVNTHDSEIEIEWERGREGERKGTADLSFLSPVAWGGWRRRLRDTWLRLGSDTWQAISAAPSGHGADNGIAGLQVQLSRSPSRIPSPFPLRSRPRPRQVNVI